MRGVFKITTTSPVFFFEGQECLLQFSIHSVSHLTRGTRGTLVHHEPLCLYTLTQHFCSGLHGADVWIGRLGYDCQLTQISLHALLAPEWSTKGAAMRVATISTEHVLAKWIGRYRRFSQNAQKIGQRGHKSITQWLNCDLPKLLPFADDIFVFLSRPPTTRHAN